MSRMDEIEARRRLAAAEVARLATVGRDGPHLVPVVFAVDGDRIVTAVDRKPKRTMKLKRLDNVATDPRVSLLVDHYDDDWDRLWWVRVDGTAAVGEGGPVRDWAVALLVAKYAQYRTDPPPGPAVIITIERVASWESAPLHG
jgi:PPOX class probable F420-dependent enzyme